MSGYAPLTRPTPSPLAGEGWGEGEIAPGLGWEGNG